MLFYFCEHIPPSSIQETYGYKCYFYIRINFNILARILNYSLPAAPLLCALIRIEGISGGGAVYPERIIRGVISLTTGDSRRGCLGAIFRFLGLCVCLYIRRG